MCFADIFYHFSSSQIRDSNVGRNFIIKLLLCLKKKYYHKFIYFSRYKCIQYSPDVFWIRFTSNPFEMAHFVKGFISFYGVLMYMFNTFNCNSLKCILCTVCTYLKKISSIESYESRCLEKACSFFKKIIWA